MAKISAITKADIKAVLAKQVRDDVGQFRRELALQRININKVVGVGNLEDFIKEWEVDFANSTTVQQELQPKSKKMKRITRTKKRSKL